MRKKYKLVLISKPLFRSVIYALSDILSGVIRILTLGCVNLCLTHIIAFNQPLRRIKFRTIRLSFDTYSQPGRKRKLNE